MSIRLNKVLTELNIGLQTAVEFLKNKKSLGEIKDDANVNTKISDEQYQALVSAFKGDKDIKNEAEKIFAKKTKEKKAEKKSTKAEDLLGQRQKFKPLGKIDLGSVGRKPAAEPKPAEPQPVKAQEPQQPAQPQPQQPEPAQEPAAKPQPAKPEPQPETQPEPQPQAGGEPKIFTLKTEERLAPKLNVVGKIDLDAINQSTRPKKKSKEERRKEREEKAAAQHQGGERKKRVRIGKERVDIEAAASQGQNGGGKKKKGGQAPQQAPQQQAAPGKGKKGKNRPAHKPMEVSEEDVARQVKETLARLTSKNQNKKGAKYRREKRDAVQERLNEERLEEQAGSKTLTAKVIK